MSDSTSTTDVKPGWKTTEFWMSIGGAGLGVAMLFGVFTGEEASGILANLDGIVGGVMSIASIVGYALSRGNAKIQNIKPELLITLLSGLVDSPEVAKKIKKIARS